MQKILLLIAIGISLSCQNQQKELKDKVLQGQENKHSKIDHQNTTDIENIGEYYSPSQIEELVNNTLKKEVKITDTTKTLNQVSCGQLKQIINFKISVDSITKYNNELHPISEELKKLLSVSKCFCKIRETKQYKSYVFIREEESHYSKLAELININITKNKIARVELAYQYGSEIQEKSILSKFDDNKNFTRTTKIKHKYIHGIGKIDSIEIINESFQIRTDGQFIKIE